MKEDLEDRKKDRKKLEKEAKEKRERYEQYKSNSRRAENKIVESWVNYITKKEALRRMLFPPVNYIQSGVQGGWNWLKENTVLGLLLEGTGSDFVSDGFYNAQSRDIVDLRLKHGDKYIDDNTYVTSEHRYAIEKNRLKALHELLDKNPNNIDLLREALTLEKDHLDLMKEFAKINDGKQTEEIVSKSQGDPSLIAQMKELEKIYNTHLEVVEKSDPNFVKTLKNKSSKYTKEELDYRAFLPHFAGGVGTYPTNEAKRLITRLGSDAMELIDTIDMDSLPAGDFKTKVENLKKNGLSDLDEFSNEEANFLLGLCDSAKYIRIAENTFAEQIKGLSDKEKNMFLANPHFGGFKVGGLSGFSADAVNKYLGNSPYINDYKKVQYNPDFIKDAYSLKGYCSNKKGFVTNPSTVFLYGDPANDSKDLKNTINHEAAHSVLHALQKNDYMAKDISKVEKAFENEIKNRLNKEFPDFLLKEGGKILGARASVTEKEKKLESELEGIMGKGKTYPRLNRAMSHLKAMGIEKPEKDLITTLDDMMYGKGSLINNEGRKVPNNLGNIKDEDVRFMVAISYFNPTVDMNEKTEEQLEEVRKKMNKFTKDNEELIEAHLDVFVRPVVSSGYNKEQHNEEKLVRFIADEQNVMNLMQTQFSNEEVTKKGVESGFKVQKKYEELQNDTYNLCENPNPISAIWNRHKPSHAHSHERSGDGSVMNHDNIIPTKSRTDLPKGNEATARVSQDIGIEPSFAERMKNQKPSKEDNIRQI